MMSVARLLVSSTIVFLKSITRPSPSASVPLVEHLVEQVEQVAVGLLDLVEQHDEYGRWRRRS